MTAQLRFAPALGEWVAQHLAQGQPPAALVDAMRERQVAPAAAQAIVGAFVRARERGLPLPVDTVALGTRLAEGPVVETNDRRIRVAMRADAPVLAVLQDVLDATECDELIALARPRLTPSTLVDPMTGRDVASGLRGSLGMFFRPAETPLIARLDRRLAELMGLPVSHGEGLQLLHYPAGAGSAPHFDFLQPSNEANRASIARSGQRISTLVCYLNEVAAGGETDFPQRGWQVTPQRGQAVYFEYDGLDERSLHASRPVLAGEKWVATKWMRERPFVSL
ncbi:2OG-Fe(II) oxygenase [Rhizobacter sp. OV335]|uniref:2OG-Fe(II) oxygenase n=1 Tax=Rhizobacter sp. OV335 TaxID=1500264 RepID=UPI00092108A2|nr:2OG-Fe(II) oxygenase [Rhizobacter sp. OV335]SHN28076.1 prolyl 4-hydroxylase [Rhizobacter sp. OV335]